MIEPDHQFVLALFRAPVVVFGHPVDLVSYLSSCGQPQDEGDLAYYTECRGLSMSVKNAHQQQTFVILLADGDTGTAVHESVHTAWAVLEYYGVPVTSDSHEILAYLTEEIFNHLNL